MCRITSEIFQGVTFGELSTYMEDIRKKERGSIKEATYFLKSLKPQDIQRFTIHTLSFLISLNLKFLSWQMGLIRQLTSLDGHWE